MSEAVQIALIAALGPMAMTMLTHWLANRSRDKQERKLDHITELSNSMLSHTVAKKEQAETKLETNLLTQLAAEKQKSTELERQVALLTPPPKTEG